MRFAFIKEWRTVWQIETMCRVMEVTTRGFRAWVRRPNSTRTRSDMRVLAHIKDQFKLSEKSYGRPRMTTELKEIGLGVGERRVGH
jgi:putative transposase